MDADCWQTTQDDVSGQEKITMQLDLHAAAYNLVPVKNLGLGVTCQEEPP